MNSKYLVLLGVGGVVGYAVGVVTLMVWAGTRLYEGAYGDDTD